MIPETERGPAEVLVVEDDPLLRRVLSLTLGRAGYGVQLAADGLSGVHIARAVRPDLILTDICMPGLDGIEAARAIRTDPALCHIPIVTMTACETPEVCARVRAAGFLGPLTKPLDIAELPRQIAHWMTPAASPR